MIPMSSLRSARGRDAILVDLFQWGRLFTGIFDFRAEHAILTEGEGVDPEFDMGR